MNESDDKQVFQDDNSFNTANLGNPHLLLEKSVRGKIINELDQSENVHVPMHIIDGSLSMNTENVSSGMSFQNPCFIISMEFMDIQTYSHLLLLNII